MNYQEGVDYMKDLVSKLDKGKKSSITRGNLVINYPGRKDSYDYKLTINGVAPKHTDIVKEIYEYTNPKNFKDVVEFLDDVYTNGLNATSTVLPRAYVEKLFWITLQEEINYPQPTYKGRKLPFQRFYEGALASIVKKLHINKVFQRTNNHGVSAPVLYKVPNLPVPSFYS